MSTYYMEQVIEETQTAMTAAATAVIVTAPEDAVVNDDAIMAAAGHVKEEAITDEREDGNDEGGNIENSKME